MPDAHRQTVSHRYVLAYPAHPPRESDPHYAAFNAYHRKTRPDATCYVGDRVGYGECRPAVPADISFQTWKPDATNPHFRVQPGREVPGLELHHRIIEFSLTNGVELSALQIDFPDVTDEDALQAWVESETNFVWLCEGHHRGYGGAHVIDAATWEAQLYVPGLVVED